MATGIVTQQTSAPPPTALVTTPAKDVRALIMSDSFQTQIKKAMPEAMSSDVLLRVAVTTIQKTPKLLECSRESLMQCVLECAQLGLLPDGILGQAYMVPYAKVATLQIGYRGIIELARRSDQVKYVVGEAVYDCDEFSISYAPIREIKHVPNLEEPTRGEKVEGKYLPTGFRGAYGLVLYKDDTIDFEYLPLHKIERIRSMSQAGSKSDGPWLMHFEEMAKKTGIRSLGKRLPLSADDLRRIVADEYKEQGMDVGYSMELPSAAPEDVEVDELMQQLRWSGPQQAVTRANYTNRRDELLEYLRGKAKEAQVITGTQLAADQAKAAVAPDPTKTLSTRTSAAAEASTTVAPQTQTQGAALAAPATSTEDW